jgi:Uma2 family endonuclease
MAQRMTEPILTATRTRRMSYQAWRRWAAKQEIGSEWVDGEVIEFMPTTLLHALIAGFVYRLLSDYVELRQLGVVVIETLEMRLGRQSRVPDILFVSNANRRRLTNQRLTGPADLVVEVISDDSVERDRETKFAEYAAAGVSEYWLLDGRPEHVGARFFRLVGEAFVEAFPDADGRYHSSVVEGFWFRPAWLHEEPLPKPWPLLAEIAPEAAHAALRTRPQSGGLGEA